MTAYYNEIDPYAAQWLRNLISAGHIAPGDVDERDIRDVRPSDLARYTQCHFFAGIGVWSHAFRRAAWSDDRPVWTGSCPCQPFSAAGAGAGFSDERHLWPHFHWLISQCRPPIVFGEQVASKDADPWIDLVQADVEALGYAFGCVPFPAASIGAPHIRDRNYWVADARSEGRISGTLGGVRRAEDGRGSRDGEPERSGSTGGLENTHGTRTASQPRDDAKIGGLSTPQRQPEDDPSLSRRGGPVSECDERNRSNDESGRLADMYDVLGLADADGREFRHGHVQPSREFGLHEEDGGSVRSGDSGSRAGTAGALRPGPTNGHWRDADWLFCRDGKWRPVEPGTFPLADGPPARVGRLRAYGNAIVAQAAQAFVEVYLQSDWDERAAVVCDSGVSEFADFIG